MNSFVGIWIFVAAVSQISANPVKITVFYESLCYDSMRFVKEQLYPTYKALQGYLDIELVPFGKAYVTTNPWSITCQHGPHECLGNAVQNCFLNKYPETNIQMNFVNCVMSSYSPYLAGKECAEKLKYDYEGIEECSTGEKGRQLQAKAGERTRNFRERLSFVPTILFNDVYNHQEQRIALRNLKSVVCGKFEAPGPEECMKL